MDNLDYIVRIFFQKVSSKNILNGTICYKNFPKKDFGALTLNEMKHMTETETEGFYQYLENHTDKETGESGLNVFRLLKDVSAQMLYIRDNVPVCRYPLFIRWRGVTSCIGEDLPVCAYLAYCTEKDGFVWNDFEWGTVTGHDNVQLMRMMQKGIADNHFHLFGAAPAFQLSWLKLMNDLADRHYADGLQEIDEHRRMSRYHYTAAYGEDSLENMHFQAALIRIVLFSYIHGIGRERICENRHFLERLLVDMPFQLMFRSDIHGYIQGLRMNVQMQGMGNDDYAALGYGRRSVNHIFEGERAFLYQMLTGLDDEGKPVPEFMMNWFYAYLVIKCKFHEELVQVSETMGFHNFSQYNRRKRNFLYTDLDLKRMVQHAVGGSFETGNMHSLEIRINPAGSAGDNKRMIQLYDLYIKECLSQEQLERTYYVLHFPKKKLERPPETSGFCSGCRHAKYRKYLEDMAESLIQFRAHYPVQAARVLGIDACAMEIGCRPEVFGAIFRRLTAHVTAAPNFYHVRQWKITYHVGEDWLDFADALRAIEEAVLFLNMKNGDRLGHATALGLDVKKWYALKMYNLILPVQDYLDNVVWLYHKLFEFEIPECEALKGYLAKEYEKYFSQIYSQYLDMSFVKTILEADGNRREGQCMGYLHFDIHAYYDAWKLRGDDPRLYRKGYYEAPMAFFQKYAVNEALPQGESIRRRTEAALLYFYYHYSAEVRHKGGETVSVLVPPAYAEGVARVQRAMQLKIAEKGIFIETNPSSNYLISAMETYGDHPLSNLFNMGLVAGGEEAENCPQLHVSINTDDKGVFHTSLENEFALMGCAMEKKTGKNGCRKYGHQRVYAWLDYIREYGKQQSFLQKISEDQTGDL